MDITIIDKGNVSYFEKMLLPEVPQMLREGAAIFALGAVEDGVACGALAGGPRNGSFFIQSFFVAQECRGKGMATALMDELVRIALQTQLTELRCEFTISCDEHRLLAAFLKERGFAFSDSDDAVVAVPLASLEKLPYYKDTKTACRIYGFNELPESLIRNLDRRLSHEDGALFDLPLEKLPLDRECSTATLKDNAIDGCMLIEKQGDRLLSLSYADAGANAGGSVFSSLLVTAYQTAVKKYPADTMVLIQPVTPLTAALVTRLAPEAESLSRSAKYALR